MITVVTVLLLCLQGIDSSNTSITATPHRTTTPTLAQPPPEELELLKVKLSGLVTTIADWSYDGTIKPTPTDDNWYPTDPTLTKSGKISEYNIPNTGPMTLKKAVKHAKNWETEPDYGT